MSTYGDEAPKTYSAPPWIVTFADLMLRLLKRWLGWDSNSGPFDFSELRFSARQNASPPKPQPQQRTPAMLRDAKSWDAAKALNHAPAA